MTEHAESTKAVSRQVDLDLGQATALFTKTGQLKLFRSNVTLTIENGGLVKPAGMRASLCSADGYKMQCRAGGLMAFMAPTVAVSGVPEANPYVLRNDKGEIVSVYARAFCVGYTEMGVPTVSSKTVVFDIHTYTLVDLLAKADRFPNDFQLRPMEFPSPGKNWAKYPIDASTAVFVDTQAAEFTKWMKNIMNRRRKAAEIAQTFAVRNATKAHPSVKFHKLDTGAPSTVVSMMCWRAVSGEMRWDLSKFDVNIKQIEGAVDGTVPPEKPVDVVDAGIDNLHEDSDAIEAEETGSLADQDDLPTSEDTEADDLFAQRTRLAQELEALKETNEKAFQKACKEVGFDWIVGELSDLKEAELIRLHKLATACAEK